jgi:hypothetical protein
MTPQGETLFNLFQEITRAQLEMLGVDIEDDSEVSNNDD